MLHPACIEYADFNFAFQYQSGSLFPNGTLEMESGCTRHQYGSNPAHHATGTPARRSAASRFVCDGRTVGRTICRIPDRHAPQRSSRCRLERARKSSYCGGHPALLCYGIGNEISASSSPSRSPVVRGQYYLSVHAMCRRGCYLLVISSW
jgi:hypothetical protein